MTLAAIDERPAELTNAQRQKAKLEKFMGAVAARSDQFGTLLADSNIDPKLFIETCRRAIMRDAELMDCDPASFIQSALNCAGDGLIPDGRKAAFVRFKRIVQYVPMYQGLLEIAYRSRLFQSIEAQVVYKGDDFAYELGDQPFIRHTRSLEADRTEIIGAYAVAKTTNGGVFREVVGKTDLAQIRAVSRASKGPNADWPGEMARKGAIRRLWKFLPKTPAMERVLEHDDVLYDAGVAAPAPSPRLHAGFDAQAIEGEAVETTETAATAPTTGTGGDADPGASPPDESSGPQISPEDEAAAQIDDTFPGDR